MLDVSTGIAGAYATKLLADAGADVVKLEPPGGDPLRRGSPDEGPRAPGIDAPLFRFLHHGKRARVGSLACPDLAALAEDADLLVESGALEPQVWRTRAPHLVVLSITPWGRTGPFAGRPASELTLQAEAGSIATRGLRGQEPFQAGGRIGEWVGGSFAAVAGLAAVRRARAGGRGEHVDVSLLECLHVAASNYLDLFHGLLGRPPVRGLPQTIETPSIERSADGWVGFCTNSAQQFSDFLLLIERPELREDASLFSAMGRLARLPEWQALVEAWTTRHPTAEIVERASLLRIPVSPVNDARGVLADPHLRTRGVFLRAPDAGFEMPRPPWKLDGAAPSLPGAAPALDGDASPLRWRAARPAPPRPDAPATAALPLDGLRVLDLTAWWAGPSATHVLAALGADVVHVESIQRPDGMRMMAGAFRDRDRWWEWSPFFLAANAGKRGIALDLAAPRGREIALRLVASVDAVVENFTPRVLGQWGLDWPAIRAANPRCILVRMPAFGLDGPWRDHPGFAQTMEQMSGMAWLTGHPEDRPRIQRGPCDPLAGLHAAFSLLLALAERERTGRGVHVECTMVEAALNAAAEAIVAWSAERRTMSRMGNRSPEAAPQGLYPCAGHSADSPRWLALSVASDVQWQALVAALERPAGLCEPRLATHAARRAAHDALDDALRAAFAARELEPTVAALCAAGVPAARVRDPREASRHPQLAARAFFEAMEHPVVGRQALPGLPFRFAGVSHWLRSPAPTLGQHTRQVLATWAGLEASDLDELEATGAIGTRPVGA